MTELLEPLNPPQREAVEYTAGPHLVVAGAGSGKTRVITYKVAYLLDRKLFRADQILAVTFTNKAAAEMEERIRALLGQKIPRLPLICTFHSFCARFLRREIEILGYPANYTIYDADDQLRTIKNTMKDLQISDKLIAPALVQFRLGQAKNRRIGPERYLEQFQGEEDAAVAKVYAAYERRMRQAGALDFDDLLLKTNEILDSQPAVRERLGRQYRYLLVDEFQDTNPPQYQLVRHLTAHHQNICVVGDEDQSIYGFRGAILANILHFEKDFPGARVFKLEQNYRSTSFILRAASAVVAHNRKRREKTLWTSNAQGDPLGLYHAVDPAEEAGWVARAVRDILLADFNASIGVLYRTNFQSRRLEDALRGQSIQYRVVGGLSFYSRKEIKDVLGYLKLMQNRHDNVAFGRVVNLPPRGIGDRTLEFIAQRAAGQAESWWTSMESEVAATNLNPRARSALEGFRDLVLDLALRSGEIGLGECVQEVFSRSGYQEYLQNLPDPDAPSRAENVRELITLAREHEREGGTLLSFMDRLSLYSDADEAEGAGRVTLMTLHGAKGLEFDYVFMVGVEDGLLPHHRSRQSEDDLEEERRLCYVGITRARRRLTLSWARTRARSWEDEVELTSPSPFLKEIPRDCVVEIPPFSPFPLALASRRAPSKEKVKLREAGFATLDSVEDVKSFFRQSPRDRSGAPSAPRIVERLPDLAANRKSPGGAEKTKPDRPSAPREPMPAPARTSRPATGTPHGASASPGGAGLKVGDRVRHPVFGAGMLLKIEKSPKGKKLTVSFDNRGLKVLLEHLAPLEKLSGR